jgi:hypothetical protein
LNIPPGRAAGIETNAELDIPRIANSSIDNNSECTLETILAEYMATLVDDDDPQNYHEAMTWPDAEEWKKAMSSEWNSLLENETFDTDTQGAPSDHAPVSCKWVFKKKENHDPTIRYKARLVFRGFQQIAGVYYDETYAPISKLATLRLLLSIAARQNWQLNHMDVVMAFLNPKIDPDNIFMEKPQGIEWLANNTLTSNDTLRLHKALYGLKQAPRLWYEDIDYYLHSLGFLQMTMDQNLYSKDDGVLLLLYVDDILIANSPNHQQEAEDRMQPESGSTSKAIFSKYWHAST